MKCTWNSNMKKEIIMKFVSNFLLKCYSTDIECEIMQKRVILCNVDD